LSSVIQVQNLSKRYRIGLKEQRYDTFAQQLLATIKAPIQNFRQLRSMSKFGEDDESVFWALKDINFEVQQGEVLGIIGHNGAGKSTLLKILSRITEPTSGEVRIKGRIAALLEVGTGFHQDLTGRENIYMNGTILGMRKKEIDQKLDEIIDFSGVEKYVDTPVKFYSSGMKVRLGFAVAAHLEPEILLIDEVLAVGDIEFQRKCLGKMESLSQGHGRTLLFVSHNMAAIQSICQKTVVLSKGAIVYHGDIIEGVNIYNGIFSRKDEQSFYKDEAIFINESIDEQGVTEVESKDAFSIKMKIQNLPRSKYNFYLIFIDVAGNMVVHERIDNFQVSGNSTTIHFRIPVLWLRPGLYSYYFKLLSSELSVAKDRLLSETYTLRVTGEVDAPKLLGMLTPVIPYEIE